MFRTSRPIEKAGIGTWTLAEFGNAMKRGVGPAGAAPLSRPSPMAPIRAHSSDRDVNDLFGYLKTLPKSANVAPPHELPFPYNIRLALGGWKLLYFNDAAACRSSPTADDKVKRGQYPRRRPRPLRRMPYAA